MPIDRSIWRRRVEENFSNSYPCPRCAKGRVLRGKNPVVLTEPHHSMIQHGMDEWEPEWVRLSFTTVLICDNTSCGEAIAVSGQGGVEYYEFHEEPEINGYSTWLKPISMYPAPPLFPIAKVFPQKVKDELKLAFQLFWTDLSASTSRLRTSLERVLDDKGIATSVPVKKGKMKRLDLFGRISLFEQATKDSDIAESMTAMRIVGNLGTHGDEVTESEYFDLLDVLEDALAEIYEEKSAKLKAKKSALIALKK